VHGEEIALLLDRRRINRWARWVALFLAVIFAGGFIFLGVGYGTNSANILAAFSCTGDDESSGTDDAAKLDEYLVTLQTDAKNVEALLGVATIYERNDQPAAAASYLEKVIEADPTQDVYVRLANLYMSDSVQDYEAAVQVLNKAATVDAANPEVFLKLGSANNLLGRTSAAILAWEKYIQLDPDGEQVSTVKAKIESLTSTTTAAAATTTTSSGDTTSSTNQ
jgi:tetratricopeptide (TPR) repeat protein